MEASIGGEYHFIPYYQEGKTCMFYY